MEEFTQIIERYESESYNLSGYIQSYKDRTVEELEQIIVDFQSLYVFGDYPDISRSLISEEDLTIFRYWEPSTQTDFLAYLAIKIAVARS